MVRSRLARVALALALLVLLLAAALGLAARHFLDPETLRSTLEAQATRAAGRPVRIGKARADLFPRIGLRLEDIEVGAPAVATASRVDVSTGLRALLSRRVEDADVALSKARLDLAALVSTPSAAGTPRKAAPTPGAAPRAESGAPSFTIASVRTIRLEDVEIQARGRPSLRLDLRGALSGDRLDVPDLELTSGRTRIQGRLALESVSERTGSFALEASMLDLDELIETVSSLAPPGQTAARGDPGVVLAKRIAGTIVAKTGRLSGLDFRALRTDVVVAGSSVALDPLALELYDGAYKGSLRLDLSGEAPRVAFKGRLENVGVAALAKGMGSSARATGHLTATLGVRGAGADALSAMRSARGSGELRIDDGSLPGLDLAHTALQFLGVAGRQAGGDTFTRLSCRLALADGRLRTDDLLLTAPDFDLRGKGSMSVLGQLDVSAEIHLSEALSAASERSVKELSYAREGGRVVLPLRIGGTVSAPTVTVDAASAAKRAAREAAGQAVGKAKRGILDKVFGR